MLQAARPRRTHAGVARAALVAPLTLLLAWVPLQRHYISDLTWYWAISWEHGFVRRGLCGQLAALLPGEDLEPAAQLMTGVSAALAVVTLVGVGLLRIARGDPVSVALGVMLVVGPVGFTMVCFDPRPEYLGFPAVLLVMASCRARYAGQRPAARVWLGLAGVLLGVVTLASENVLFAVLPWCVVLMMVTTVTDPTAERLRLLGGLIALPVVAATLVLVDGRASASQLVALRNDADRLDGDAGRFMRFVGQDLGDSVRMVTHSEVDLLLVAMAVAVALVVLLGVALSVCGVGREWSRVPRDLLVNISLCGPVAALLFQSATGVDWPRWVGQLGCGALLTLTAWGLLVPDPDPARWSVRRASVLVLCCSLLLSVPAVPYNIQPGGLREFVASRMG